MVELSLEKKKQHKKQNTNGEVVLLNYEAKLDKYVPGSDGTQMSAAAAAAAAVLCREASSRDEKNARSATQV